MTTTIERLWAHDPIVDVFTYKALLDSYPVRWRAVDISCNCLMFEEKPCRMHEYLWDSDPLGGVYPPDMQKVGIIPCPHPSPYACVARDHIKNSAEHVVPWITVEAMVLRTLHDCWESPE